MVECGVWQHVCCGGNCLKRDLVNKKNGQNIYKIYTPKGPNDSILSFGPRT